MEQLNDDILQEMSPSHVFFCLISLAMSQIQVEAYFFFHLYIFTLEILIFIKITILFPIKS